MNGKDIFLGLKYIGEDLIDEAEHGQFSSHANKADPTRSVFRKPLMIAALIGLMVFLMGCAVIYFKMENIRLGEQEVSYDKYDYDTMEYLGKETYTEQVFTIAGLQGTNTYQAAKEWFDFEQSYDPDHSIQSAVWGNYPEYPAEYSSYYLYSQDMKDALDGILTKYGLKTVGAPLEFRNTQNMCAALGIERIQTVQNNVTISVDSGGCYENGNFYLSLDFTLPEAAENELNTTWGVLRWNRSDCFSDEVISLENADDWTAWNYTTASGTDVLIIRADSDWRGYILCDRPEGILSLQVETKKELWNNVDGKTWAEECFLTDDQMEQIADAIDFGIQPRVATQADVDNQPTIPNASTQDGYTVTLKSVETDGYAAKITMSITAPEGTVISRNPHEEFEDVVYHIGPANLDNFECQTGRIASSSGGWNLVDDGDGLENTQDIIMVNSVRMDDSSAPFGPGMVWNIYFAGLEGHYYDSSTYTDHADLLTEGEWLFPITFNESNGDFKEIEFLSEPITTEAITGFRADGTDVYGDVTITSFSLRSLSATITCEADYAPDFTNNFSRIIYAVMKDGSQIQLYADSGSPGIQQLMSAEPIDLEQVDYILLADGTKLSVPET